MSVDSLVEQFNTEALALAAQPCAKPLIGVTANFSEGQLQLAPGYFRSVEAAGGIPVIIAPKRMPNANMSLLLDRIDGLLLSGGADINPILVGEDPVPALHGINTERDLFELTLTRLAYNRQIPMLGICRGIQVLAAALGGTIMQDIATSLPHTQLIKHSQDADRATATHFVEAVEGSRIAELLGKRFAVNSFHHQAVGQCGPRFRITAQSADGVIEAIESTEMKSIIGVQWHPECFIAEGDTCMMPLFQQFVNDASEFAQARRVHNSVLTLDSHCDTPMFFDQDVNLEHRDPKLLVDFPKMREGHLDVSTMVAYLPQGDCTPEASEAATAQAFKTLDEIEQRVAHAPGVVLAQHPAQLYHNKLEGKLSVMRGIENGYAIGKDLQNVEKFARMGVVYITLCHNGDNDICDSARRSSQRHGGLSAFGRDVVREMNRCGLMVDLSHAAETSFYDALQCSTTPIVCSHASSRAMCNHPRNLTDDQLRALAQAGGVAQVTLYHGFLRLEEEGIPATITDGVRHLMHMIDVAGIDHVGIGTDFDGDGGVPGCACASELINFTRLLLAEGLTIHDLQKIWGGNWLRVMQQCQDTAEILG
uniref:membrane dipeptidase n=1 Tax=Alloprevotella sp. TaxID=1872471 RepID=UPI003FEEC15D